MRNIVDVSNGTRYCRPAISLHRHIMHYIYGKVFNNKNKQKQTKRSKTTTATKKQKLPMQLVEMPKKAEGSPENARAHNAPYSTSPTKNNLFMNTL